MDNKIIDGLKDALAGNVRRSVIYPDAEERELERQLREAERAERKRRMRERIRVLRGGLWT